jgi:hypothetical protein
MTLKDRFMEAVSSGELGEADEHGVVVSLREFKLYFSDVKSDYINSFLPASVIEIGQYSATHTKFLFRIKKGLYRVHPDAIAEFRETLYADETSISHINKVEEVDMLYQPVYIS